MACRGTARSLHGISDGHLLPALDARLLICFCIHELEIVEVAIDQMRLGAHHLEEPLSVTARLTLKCWNKVPLFGHISIHVHALH